MMVGSTRFESSSNSPEGSLLTAGYPNGQRVNYSGPSLDRSGSFRENVESRILSSGSSASRGVNSSEILPLIQSLSLDQFSSGEHKVNRLVEIRRILGASVGITSEDHSVGAVHLKSLFPGASLELKRFKETVLETSTRARDKVKALNDSITKLDKYRATLLSRKRQRSEISTGDRLSGTNLLKMGSPHQNTSEFVSQRQEERTKNGGAPNKRVRTSVVESEGRSTSLLRPGMPMEKDRDTLRAGNGSSVQVEDKIRGHPPGGDGWDKRMKRKRSMGTMVTRTMDGDRDIKRGMQQKLNIESRSRPCEGHGFRSGYSAGHNGTNKLDGNSQLSSTARAMPRNDVDHATIPNDKRDRSSGLDKERVIAKVGTKLNIRDDNQFGNLNTSPVTKGKASRAPRTGSGVLTSSSSSLPRPGGTLEGWEHSPCLNKSHAVNGASNRKRPISAGSSSPPVTQWGGQRSQKNSRARRSNLVSPVSMVDEAPIISEGFQSSDIGTRLTSIEDSGPQLGRALSNNSQQYKLKIENVSSPAAFSESEESGAGENKSNDKALDNGEIEDRVVNPLLKVGAFTMKKNKIFMKEEIGDGVRRQGRSGRGLMQSRTCLPSKDKVDSMATTKPLKNMKPGFDKTESKSGRPPTKRMSDRKAFIRPGKVVNSGSSEFTGESDDDNEELLAAANAARNASQHACSGPFWKKMESFFALVAPEDMAYLKQQIRFSEELDDSFACMFSSDRNAMDQSLRYGERLQRKSNGIGQKQDLGDMMSHDDTIGADAHDGKLEAETWLQKIIPLSQRLLSAFIVEDENEDFDHASEWIDASSIYNSDDSPCGTSSHNDNGDRIESEIESEVDLKIQKHNSLDNFSCDGSTASNGFRSPKIHSLHYNDEAWLEDDVLRIPEVGQNNHHGANSVQMNFSDVSSFDCQYQQMCLDDRILTELHSIGLFPETVPDLAEVDEEINKDISELKRGLYIQVRKQKGYLCNVDRSIQKVREKEERDFELVSLNKLIEMAYKKYMSCRGSGNKGGVAKVARQVALAFIKRTLARCQKFEHTGRSCFSEPALKDLVFSPITCSNDSKSVHFNSMGTAGNVYSESQTRSCEPESRLSAAGALASGNLSSTAERRGSINENLDRPPSDALQTFTCANGQAYAEEEFASNRGKKREVLLDDLGVSASRGATLGDTLPGGVKGKRSEREREQNKDTSGRGSVAKAGRPLSNAKGERKTKTKPKQKTAQLSTSGNGLSRFPEASSLSETMVNDNDKASRELGNLTSDAASKGLEEPLDFSNLQLPGLDLMDGLDGPVDLGWFNIDDEGLQDHDLVGLPVPMDDLNMIL